MLVLLCSLLWLLPSSMVAATACGDLSVHVANRLATGATHLGSVSSLDMQDCLDQCCRNPECSAVTMTGVIRGGQEAEDNAACLLAACAPSGCSTVLARPEESLITILLQRNDTVHPTSRPSSAVPSPSSTSSIVRTSERTTRPPPSSSSSPSSPSPSNSSSSLDFSRPILYTSQLLSDPPVWAVALVALVLVTLLGAILTCVCACIWSRGRRHSKNLHKNTANLPPLHAFNPAPYEIR